MWEPEGEGQSLGEFEFAYADTCEVGGHGEGM